MKVELIAAGVQLKSVIKNLARFYVYELSKYVISPSRSKIPEDGLYEAYDLYFHFDNFWEKSGYYPFIIRVEDELAGFVLINKNGSESDVDWYMAEFFVIAKFQGKGIGQEIAIQVFNRFSGIWEVKQMPGNSPAIKFWHSVVNRYTNGQFSKSTKRFLDPEAYDMIVLKFDSSIKQK
jgi:[ribosomal protein S5]-alanine N-acetyltransferase